MGPALVRRLMLCAALLLAAARLAAQIVWNPTSQFSTTNGNPNGVWTYGWMDTGFATFTPYTNHTANQWYGWGGDLTPAIWLNTGTSTSYGVPPGYLSLHPGNGNEPTVLRWTAPTGYSGTTQVSGQFLSGDGGVMQLAIFQNTKSTGTLWTASDYGAFDLSVNIVSGDTLNFAVFGGYAYGNTPFSFTITGVPEPSTWALLVVGGLGLIAARRKRQSPGAAP